MPAFMSHPSIVLAALAAVSGLLGSFGREIGFGEPPHPGLHMVLTGLWFGIVVAFGVWCWGKSSLVSAVTAVAVTWVGWEVAFNLAMLGSNSWLKPAGISELTLNLVGGSFAGAVGAFLTWLGTAMGTSSLRRRSVAASVVATGAVFGLLVPLTFHFDGPAVLLIPWQFAVAAVLGSGLAPQHEGT